MAGQDLKDALAVAVGRPSQTREQLEVQGVQELDFVFGQGGAGKGVSNDPFKIRTHWHLPPVCLRSFAN